MPGSAWPVGTHWEPRGYQVMLERFIVFGEIVTDSGFAPVGLNSTYACKVALHALLA